MSQHLNRLNDEEAVEFDKAFGEFCKTENEENEMKLYLVEVVLGKRLETIAVKTNFEVAFGLIKSGQVGLITEMIVDEVYPEGIGVCNHWHFDPDEKDDEGNRLDGLEESNETN